MRSCRLGHGLGWLGYFDPDLIQFYAQFRPTGASVELQCLLSSVVPCTFATLLPLAALAMRGAIGTPTNRRWILAVCGAGFVAHGSRAWSPIQNPDIFPWPLFAAPLGTAAAVGIALVLCVRAWHASLDDDPDATGP